MAQRINSGSKNIKSINNTIAQNYTWHTKFPNNPFTWYSRLSNRLYNRFDNRLYRVNKHPTGCQTGCHTGLTTGLTTGCIHDTTDCQTGLTTGLTTGCIVYTNIYPVVKPDWQPAWQQVVSCKRGLSITTIITGYMVCVESLMTILASAVPKIWRKGRRKSWSDWGSLKGIGNVTIRQSAYEFLSAFNFN